MENIGYAQVVVDVAKDTIQVLSRLDQTSDMYRTRQVLFDYFILSSLAVLLLAAFQAPSEFSNQVRDEFYMALDLVKGFSTNSCMSKRLWRMIKELREVGEKLGIPSPIGGPNPCDAHSDAAIAMAGLAGHPIEALSIHGGVNTDELGSGPVNGFQISDELANFFEAVDADGNSLTSGSAAERINGFVNGVRNPKEGLPSTLRNSEEISRIFRDLF